jgi:Phosphoglycerol transferase and related proteins, alkaline phosphatase superfamily
MIIQILKNLPIVFKGFIYFIFTVVSVVGMLACAATNWMMQTWQELSMDEILFHLKVPIEGTNQDMVMAALSMCIPLVVAMLLMAIITLIYTKKKKELRFILMLGITCFSIGATDYMVRAVFDKYELKEWMANRAIESDYIEQNYIDPRTVALEFPEEKRNLIYIYLESMESTYASVAEGGGFAQNYIPELTRIAAENISFSNTDRLGGGYPTYGTTWTMGAMFAQTAGLPLIIPINQNEMSTQDTFFPSIVTLGDILDDAGYRQVFMIGSPATFGGRKNYYTIHGDYEIWDYYTAQEQGKIAADYSVFWGYEDQKLFSYAKERLTSLSREEGPFNFTMLTVDTHFPDGWVCELCPDYFAEDQYANVMACSSRQVQDFLTWIQAQPFYENTTVILAGDHLTMNGEFASHVPMEQRRVYNAFINSAVTTQNTTFREFITMDMFPTTLASLGVKIAGDRLALGTNLFSEVPTLAERDSLQRLNLEFERQSTFFEHFTRDIVIPETEE